MWVLSAVITLFAVFFLTTGSLTGFVVCLLLAVMVGGLEA